MDNHWAKPQIGVDGNYKGKQETSEQMQARLFFLGHPGVSNKEIAGEFKVTEFVIRHWREAFQWDAIYAEYYEDFIKMALEERSRLYMTFLRDNYFKSQSLLDTKLQLFEEASKTLGLIEGEPAVELTHKQALDIIKQTSIPDIHKIILRDLEVPYNLNDSTRLEIKQIKDKEVDDYSVVQTIESLQRALK